MGKKRVEKKRMKERVVIAISGKGGVGKTTVTALMLKTLIEAGEKSILAVDSNPDSNLPDLLGIPFDKTVASVAAKLKEEIGEGSISPTMSKKDLLEYRVFETLKETPKFDLLVMGRGEGEGCYCSVNNLLTAILDTLTKNYDLTLMDTDAGLEHLSRRTDRDVDFMVIVTTPNQASFQTAMRIRELAKEVHIEFKKIFLVGNMFGSQFEALLLQKAKNMDMELAGVIPRDEKIIQYSSEGKPIMDLPEDSPAVSATRNILRHMKFFF